MLGLFGLDVGHLVEEAIRKIVDLLVPDFAAGWATSLVTALVAVPDVTGPGFERLEGLREALLGVGFALLSLCVVAGGLQVWLAGIAAGGLRAGELLRRAVAAAAGLAVFPGLLQAASVGTNLATSQLIGSHAVQQGLDATFGQAFAFGIFTQGLSLGLAIPAAVAVAWFTLALLVMKAGLTALLAVLALSGPLVLGLSPLPQAHWLVRAWAGGLGAALLVSVAWALVFSAAGLLAGDALSFAGGPLAPLAKPVAAIACFWLAYRTPGFLLAAARSIGIQPSAIAGAGNLRATIRGRTRNGDGSAGPGGSATSPRARFERLAARTPAIPPPHRLLSGAARATRSPGAPQPGTSARPASGRGTAGPTSNPANPGGRPTKSPAGGRAAGRRAAARPATTRERPNGPLHGRPGASAPPTPRSAQRPTRGKPGRPPGPGPSRTAPRPSGRAAERPPSPRSSSVGKAQRQPRPSAPPPRPARFPASPGPPPERPSVQPPRS